jgi:hypothetical protein
MKYTVDNLNFEAARITLLWNGVTQPLGFFRKAKDAVDAAKTADNSWPSAVDKWELQTPVGRFKIEQL